MNEEMQDKNNILYFISGIINIKYLDKYLVNGEQDFV